MAKHIINFKNEGIISVNSINWEIYYDGRTAFFLHNEKLRFSFIPEKGIEYLFNAEKGDEWVKPFVGPRDSRMNAFWKRGFYKGHWDIRLKEVGAQGRVYERMFWGDVPEAILEDLSPQDHEWLGHEPFSHDWWEIYGINCNGWYRTQTDKNGRVLIAAYKNYESGHTKVGFYYDPEVSLDQVEDFLKDYPWGK